jgi:hypothetical protein
MQRPETSRLHTITTDDLPSFWVQGSLPTPSQQANALIVWVGDHQPTSFDLVEIHRSELAAIIGLQISQPDDSGGFSWLNTQLEPKKLYELGPRGNKLALKLTMAGWEKHGELKKTTVESRDAFMAMKFGQPDLNRAVDECFRPAVAKTGFELRLLTDKQPAGLIDNQLRAAILASRFVISDLTHGSPGASIAAQGCADPACRPDCRSHAGNASSGRTTPPIFQSVSFRQGQGQPIKAD